jgi:hypothetical protein
MTYCTMFFATYAKVEKNKKIMTLKTLTYKYRFTAASTT